MIVMTPIDILQFLSVHDDNICIHDRFIVR